MKVTPLALLAVMLFAGCSKKEEVILFDFSGVARSETEDERWRLYILDGSEEYLLTEGVVKDGKLVSVFEFPATEYFESFDGSLTFLVPAQILVTGDRSFEFSGHDYNLERLEEVTKKFEWRPFNVAIVIQEPVDLVYFESILDTLFRNFRNEIRLWIGVDYIRQFPKLEPIHYHNHSVESKN